MSTPENPKGTKNPITLKIKFKSANIEQFIERYSVDVSKGGIFIRTKEPLAVGNPLKFEFQLQDGTALISGEGTVVWNRAADPNRPSVVPGMGVRFDKLTADSQRVLERILSDKDKGVNSGVESRFDAGVRASLGGAPEPVPSQETPKGNMFGEEPTRAMSADQVNKLAEATQRAAMEDDMPTKAAFSVKPSDLSDEVRKLGGNMDGSGSLPAIPASGVPLSQKLEPMRAPAANPMARSTLLGQGFGLGASPSLPKMPIPAAAPPSAPALPDPVRAEASGAAKGAGSASLDSAVTPVKSEEVAARVADSQRTPNEAPAQALSQPSQAPVPPAVAPPAPQATPAPAQSSPSVPPVKEAPAQTQKPAAPSGGSKGLLIGAAVLVLLVAAAGYFVFVAQKPPTEVKPTPTEVQPPQPPPPQPPPALQQIPAKGTGDAAKPGSDSASDGKGGGKPGEAAAGTGLEVTSEPAGAQVEFAGKTIGQTPLKLPELAAGKSYDLKVSLRGYQEVHQKLKGGEDKQPIAIKLVQIERQLEILSVPKGADVYIDGKKVGRTPWILRKVDLSKTISVEIKRQGFESWTHNVSDAESFVLRNKKEVLTLNATLEPSAAKKGAKVGKKTEDAQPAGKADSPKQEEAPKKAAEPEKAEAASP